MTTRDIPPKYRAMYKRAMSGRSRKAAMRIFCLECVYYSEMEVSLSNCPLYPYRGNKTVRPPLKEVVEGMQNDDPSTIEKKNK